MDRNKLGGMSERLIGVALRKESVDRNGLGFRHYRDDVSSLSARRAWIEIVMQEIAQQRKQVALRKESVDRNSSGVKADSVSQVALRKESVDRNDGTLINCNSNFTSLSARRAWIEMCPGRI